MSTSGTYTSKLLVPIDELVRLAGDAQGLTFQILKAPRFGYRSTVLFLEARSNRYVLKILDPAENDDRELLPAQRVQTALSTRGIPVVSPLKWEDGRFFATVGGNTCILYPEASGSLLESGPGGHRQLAAAGETLAKIHTTDRGGLGLRTTSIREVAEACVASAATLSSPVDLEIDRLRDLHFDEHQDALLHGDFRAQNVLFRVDVVSCVLDWDDAVVGPRLLDLCYSLIFFQAVIRDEAPTVDAMQSFLMGYEGENPLTPDEWDRMSDHLFVALFKGLTLWTRIWNDTRDPGVKARTQTWIETYAPLGVIIPSITTRLRT